MSADTDGISMVEIAVNELVWRSLNPGMYEASEDTTEALDRLSEIMRKVGLGVTIALLELAQAIEKTKGPA
jgi:hypothetical protein